MLFLLAQVLDADVTEFYTGTMTTEAYKAFLVEETGVVEVVDSVRIAACSVGVNVVSLTSLADVTVKDNLAVDCYGDVVTYSADFLSIPFSGLGRYDALGGNDTVY